MAKVDDEIDALFALWAGHMAPTLRDGDVFELQRHLFGSHLRIATVAEVRQGDRWAARDYPFGIKMRTREATRDMLAFAVQCLASLSTGIRRDVTADVKAKARAEERHRRDERRRAGR